MRGSCQLLSPLGARPPPSLMGSGSLTSTFLRDMQQPQPEFPARGLGPWPEAPFSIRPHPVLPIFPCAPGLRPEGSPAPGEDTCLPHSPGPACCSQPASSLSLPPPAASAGSSGTGPSGLRAGSRGHRRPASAGLRALPQRSCRAPEGARGRGAPQAPPAALRSARSPLWRGRTGGSCREGPRDVNSSPPVPSPETLPMAMAMARMCSPPSCHPGRPHGEPTAGRGSPPGVQPGGQRAHREAQ